MMSGMHGRPDIGGVIINAQPGCGKPVIVHTHGGGFVLGDATRAIESLQPIATALDCVIVTVDYRFAPETTFAGSIEDNYAALKRVHDQAAALGADRRRIAVMGRARASGIPSRSRSRRGIMLRCRSSSSH